MPRIEGKTRVRSWNDTRRINALKKKKKSTKTKKKTAAAAGGARRNPARSRPVNYGDAPAEKFASMLDNGMDEEYKRRLTAFLAEDDSAASDSDDNSSAPDVCCLFRPIVGSSVRASRCCANDMMPAQEGSEESEEYDSDKSDETSTGAASVVSEAFVPKRQAETMAKKLTATKAGQVRPFLAQPLCWPSPARDVRWICSLHFGESPVQRDACRRRRSL
jgi:hypothetical protein